MLRRRFCFCVACAVAALAAYLMMFATPAAATAQDKATPKAKDTPPVTAVSFIKDVAPILKENCFACHDAKKKSGKHEMTTFEKLMAGGSDGPQITAGKAKDSDFHDLIVTTEQ